MSQIEPPESRLLQLTSLCGPEGARAIVEAVNRLISMFSEEQVLGTREVAERLGVSRKIVQRLAASGELPKPIRIIGNRLGWRKSDFEKWLAGRPPIARQ
jgi:excisionase family DNA binding protein